MTTFSGGTIDGSILPSQTGHDLGSSLFKWDAFLQDLDISGTFSGSPTFSGNPIFSGNLIIDTLTVGKIDGIFVVDGVKYARTVAGIKAAVDSLGTGPGIVVLTPPSTSGGEYSDDGTTTVLVSHDRQHIVGQGRWSPAIAIAAGRTSANPIFKFYSGSAAILYQCSIGNIAFDATNNTNNFIALQFINTSKTYLHDIDLYDPNWPTATSTAIDIQGQDLFTLSRMNLAAGTPISIKKNPHNPPRFDFDQSKFDDLELYPADTSYGIVVGPQVSITHWLVENAVVAGGKGFLNWTDTLAASAVSSQITFIESHHEQGKDAAAYSWRIDHTGAATAVQTLSFINVGASIEGNGWYLRGTHQTTLLNSYFPRSGGTSINADNSNTDLSYLNPLFQTGSTLTDTSITGIAVNKISGVQNNFLGQVLFNGTEEPRSQVTPNTSSGSFQIRPPAANKAYISFTENTIADRGAIGFDAASSVLKLRKTDANGAVLLGLDTGGVAIFNGIATVSGGIPAEYAAVDLTAQGAAITTTTLYAVPATGAGQYRVSWNAKITTAATTGAATSTLGALTIVYTDPDGVSVTITAPATIAAGTIATTSAANTTGTVLVGLPLMLNCKLSTNITYAMAYASNTAAEMKFNLHIKCEAM